MALQWQQLLSRMGLLRLRSGPFPPGYFFDYELYVPFGMAGTFFYHSHVGFQATSATGPLIVRNPLALLIPGRLLSIGLTEDQFSMHFVVLIQHRLRMRKTSPITTMTNVSSSYRMFSRILMSLLKKRC